MARHGRAPAVGEHERRAARRTLVALAAAATAAAAAVTISASGLLERGGDPAVPVGSTAVEAPTAGGAGPVPGDDPERYAARRRAALDAVDGDEERIAVVTLATPASPAAVATLLVRVAPSAEPLLWFVAPADAASPSPSPSTVLAGDPSLDAASAVVMAVVARADGATLRTLAADPAVRLVDIAPTAELADPAAYRPLPPAA